MRMQVHKCVKWVNKESTVVQLQIILAALTDRLN